MLMLLYLFISGIGSLWFGHQQRMLHDIFYIFVYITVNGDFYSLVNFGKLPVENWQNFNFLLRLTLIYLKL